MVKRLKIFLSGCFCWIALVDTASNLFQKRILMQPSGSAGSGVSMLLYFTALRSCADLKWICEIDCMSMWIWLCSKCFSMPLFNARSRSMCMNGYIGLLAPMRIELFGWTSSVRCFASDWIHATLPLALNEICPLMPPFVAWMSLSWKYDPLLPGISVKVFF